MTIIDRFKDGFRTLLGPQPARKSAYNVTPVGVQGRPQRPNSDINSLMAAYRTSEIVYSCINVKAQAAVDPRLIVERRSKGDTWTEVDGHPMRRLIMRPNPMMDEAGFARAVLTSMDIAGVFYAEIVRAGNRPNGLPQALYPLDPSKMRPIPDAVGGVSAYEWRDGAVVQIIPAADVLVWRNYDPQNRYQGLSPLSVALGSVVGDNLQTDYIRSFFDTGGVPSGILTIKNREVDQDESNIIRSKWRAKFNPRYGGIKDDIAVLDMNAEFQVLGSRLDQLQNEEVRGVAESRICMVFGVPPLIVYAYIGLLRATYSNLKEAWAQFWTSYLTPWFKQYRSWLTWSLLIQFESEESIYGERVRLAHDMSEVAALQDDVNAKHERARANLTAGGLLINEFREMIGQTPDTINGNAYLRNFGMAVVPFDPPKGEDGIATGAEIQSQVLNGAQIAGLTSTLQAVSAGELAPVAAIEVLVISFPTVDRATITTMVNAAAAFKPASAEPVITIGKPMPADTGKAALPTATMPPATLPPATLPPLPTGLKRMAMTPEAQAKSIQARDRIAARNVNKVQKYLMGQYTKAASAVRDYEKDGAIHPETKAARSMNEYVADLLDDGEDVAETTRGLFTAGIKKSYEDGAATIQVDLSFDLENESVQKVLGDLLKQVKSDIPATTIEQIRTLIGRQAEEGWSIDRLADEILAKGGVQSPYRARMIAHTETARAYTKGSILAFSESGVVDELEWNSTIDDATSDICRSLNGRRVKIGNNFEGGIDGPPGHAGSCRSAIIPIVKG